MANDTAEDILLACGFTVKEWNTCTKAERKKLVFFAKWVCEYLQLPMDPMTVSMISQATHGKVVSLSQPGREPYLGIPISQGKLAGPVKEFCVKALKNIGTSGSAGVITDGNGESVTGAQASDAIDTNNDDSWFQALGWNGMVNDDVFLIGGMF